MKLFLSGPMRGKPNYNYAEFFRVAADLRAAGHEVVSPAEHDIEAGWVYCQREVDYGTPGPCAWMREHGLLSVCEVVLADSFDIDTALAWCLEALEQCDGIYMLDGWNESEGAVKEWEAAIAQGKPVYVDGYPPARQLLEGPPATAAGEVRVVNEATGGEKGRKLARFDLLPAHPLKQVAEHYGKGAEKYDDRNWERGYDWSLSYGALQRHANAFWAGETFDPETGSHHMAAVVFHALALMEFGDTHPELDDRPKNGMGQRPTPQDVADAVTEIVAAVASSPAPEPMKVLADGDSGLGVRPNALGHCDATRFITDAGHTFSVTRTNPHARRPTCKNWRPV